MFNPFICGSFHHHQEEEEDDEPWSPRSPPRKSRKRSFCRSRDSKNPYAKRGLDKFSALLADLEDQRQKIYTEMGSEGISFVRFVYSNSNDFRPIVVMVKDKKHKTVVTHNNLESSSTRTTLNEVQQPRMVSDQNTKKKKSFTWDMKFDNWRRPCIYLLAIIILILLFLAMFGRSFAIICTSIGWYFVPTIKERSLNLKRPRKKKKYIRRLSENKIVSDGVSSP